MSSVGPGDRISNYILDRCVGTGSFAEVWRARHHVLDEVVAIKIPMDPDYVRNLQREGVVIHGLKHPNIVRAIDMDPFGDPPYLVMEFVDGPSLREAIDHAGAAFPIESAVVILKGILRALTAAHAAGIIHRDLKPANILLSRSLSNLGEVDAGAVKVTDFGLGSVGGNITQSLMQSGSLLTEQGKSIAGTWAYMSPEQKQGSELDARSDLYSCGIILFEMLTGERPQGFDLPSTLRSEVPAWCDDVVRRSFARLGQRFESAEAMLAALSPDGERGQHFDATVPPNEAVGPSFVRRRDSSKCPACEIPVDRDDQFCIRCGHQLVAAVPRCPKCQSYVHHGDRFCIACGKDLGRLT